MAKNMAKNAYITAITYDNGMTIRLVVASTPQGALAIAKAMDTETGTCSEVLVSQSVSCLTDSVLWAARAIEEKEDND